MKLYLTLEDDKDIHSIKIERVIKVNKDLERHDITHLVESMIDSLEKSKQPL